MGHETELHRAVRALLVADTAIAASVGARVYDVAGPDAALPCIELGAPVFAVAGTDTSDEIAATLNLGIYARGTEARTVIRRIAGELSAVLHRKAASLIMTNWRAVNCRYVDTTIFEVEANPTAPEFKGVVRFRVQIESAAAVTGA